MKTSDEYSGLDECGSGYGAGNDPLQSFGLCQSGHS